ncbi:MAG: hypothetical protein PVH00_12565 [Gemmatimonadota bacterium]|jgi:hypothetical protein
MSAPGRGSGHLLRVLGAAFGVAVIIGNTIGVSTPSRAPETPRNAAARSRWAHLLTRIQEVFPLRCPDCGADLRILAFLTEPGPVQAVLRHLGLPAAPPPLSPTSGPPQPDLGFDPEPDLDLDATPPFDPSEPEPVPDFADADPDPDGGA